MVSSCPFRITIQAFSSSPLTQHTPRQPHQAPRPLPQHTDERRSEGVLAFQIGQE